MDRTDTTEIDLGLNMDTNILNTKFSRYNDSYMY